MDRIVDLTRNDIQGAIAYYDQAVAEGTWDTDKALLLARLQDDPSELTDYINSHSDNKVHGVMSKKQAADSFTLLDLPAAKHKGEERDKADYKDDLEEIDNAYGGEQRDVEAPQNLVTGGKDIEEKKEEDEEGVVNKYTESAYLPGVHPPDHPKRHVRRRSKKPKEDEEVFELQPEDLEEVTGKSAVTAPGKEKVVRELKNKPGVENPWAVAWDQYDKEHGRKPKKESKMRDKLADVLDKYFHVNNAPGDANSSPNIDENYGGEERDTPAPQGKQSKRKTAKEDRSYGSFGDETTPLGWAWKQWTSSTGGSNIKIENDLRSKFGLVDEDIFEVLRQVDEFTQEHGDELPEMYSKQSKKKIEESEKDKEKDASLQALAGYPGGLNPPKWVPKPLHQIWRAAVERYIEEEGGDPHGDDAYRGVVTIYKGLLKKYGPPDTVYSLPHEQAKNPRPWEDHQDDLGDHAGDAGGPVQASLKTASRTHVDMAFFAKQVLGLDSSEEDAALDDILDEAGDEIAENEDEDGSEPSLTDIDSKLDEVLDFLKTLPNAVEGTESELQG